MNPELTNSNVRANCPDCFAITTFEFKEGSRGEFGSIIVDGPHDFNGSHFLRIIYRLLRCAGCGRAGLVELHDQGNGNPSVIGSFFPFSVRNLELPSSTPHDIIAEYREAEQCASFGALRAASALTRSALEKTLKANGYSSGNLADKIDKAAEDGVITESRKNRAHADVRVLGNDVLHEEWRSVGIDEVDDALKYTHRILEDFYDDRPSVEAVLKSKGRIS